MVNGGGLNPGPLQWILFTWFPKPLSTSILPYPDSAGNICRFHQTGDVSVYPRNLYYSTSDMSLDSRQ